MVAFTHSFSFMSWRRKKVEKELYFNVDHTYLTTKRVHYVESIEREEPVWLKAGNKQLTIRSSTKERRVDRSAMKVKSVAFTVRKKEIGKADVGEIHVKIKELAHDLCV